MAIKNAGNPVNFVVQSLLPVSYFSGFISGLIVLIVFPPRFTKLPALISGLHTLCHKTSVSSLFPYLRDIIHEQPQLIKSLRGTFFLKTLHHLGAIAKTVV